MGIKRDKYDAIFSDLIRERANWTCEYCGIKVEGRSAHCAHIHGRKSQATRYDPDNAVCLCAKDHYYFTDHPTEFTRWLENYLGEGHLDILREKVNRIKKWYKGEKDEMLKHYKEQKKSLKEKRDEGEIGRIDFEGWD